MYIPVNHYYNIIIVQILGVIEIGVENLKKIYI